MKRRFLTLIMLSAMILRSALAEPHTYTFNISDAIPREVQLEIISTVTGSEGVIGKSAKSGSMTALLEKYLNSFGIYPPVDRASEITPWLQETLASLGRITEIPRRYTGEREILDWLKRYAMPGDLLLYRANGQPDRCLLYAGDGRYVGKREEKYALLAVPATFVASDGKRTSSSGLYAIGRLWSEPKDEPACLEFVLNDHAASFTGLQFTLFVPDPETGFFVRSDRYVFYESSPGIFRLWDGQISGVIPEELFSGVWPAFCLALSGQNPDQMAWRIYYSPEDWMMDEQNRSVSIRPERTSNLHRWTGRDLLRSLFPENR